MGPQSRIGPWPSPSSKLSDWAFTEQENAIATARAMQEEFFRTRRVDFHKANELGMVTVLRVAHGRFHGWLNLIGVVYQEFGSINKHNHVRTSECAQRHRWILLDRNKRSKPYTKRNRRKPIKISSLYHSVLVCHLRLGAFAGLASLWERPAIPPSVT